jgi:hypothetical protein
MLIGIRLDLLRRVAKSWSQDSLNSHKYFSSIQHQAEYEAEIVHKLIHKGFQYLTLILLMWKIG